MEKPCIALAERTVYTQTKLPKLMACTTLTTFMPVRFCTFRRVKGVIPLVEVTLLGEANPEVNTTKLDGEKLCTA
jgi:hypothetical protein